MTRRPPRCSAWLILGVVVVLAACAKGGTNSPGRDDAGTSATGAPSTPVSTARLSVRDDLVDAAPVPWRSWRVSDDRTLEFTVTAGPADCYAARPEVVETSTTVGVRLWVGRLPEAAGRECPAIALAAVIAVRLADSLGTRRVESLT